MHFCNFVAQGYSPSQEKGFCDGPFLPKCSPQTKCPLSTCSRGKERKRLSRKSGGVSIFVLLHKSLFYSLEFGEEMNEHTKPLSTHHTLNRLHILTKTEQKRMNSQQFVCLVTHFGAETTKLLVQGKHQRGL